MRLPQCAAGQTDKLYHKFTISPREFSKKDKKETSHVFLGDAETGGTVKFYVYYLDKSNNRKYVDSDGREASAEAPWASYHWSANEEKMNLILSSDNTIENAIDLSGVRTLCMNQERDTADRMFYVEAKLELNMSVAAIAELVPAASSETDPEKYMRFHYSSTLAKTAKELGDSSWRGNLTGSHKYFKSETGFPELTFNGDNSTELGINVRELADTKPQVIHATALLNLSKWSNYKAVLEETQEVNFKMHLQQRQNDGKYEDVSTAEDYIDYLMVGESTDGKITYKKVTINNNSWTWSATKTSDTFVNYTEGNGFVVPVTFAVKVSTDQEKWEYANYRLNLEVEFIDKDGRSIAVTQVDNKSLEDYVTYTVAKISTEFIDHRSDNESSDVNGR